MGKLKGNCIENDRFRKEREDAGNYGNKRENRDFGNDRSAILKDRFLTIFRLKIAI